MEVIKIILFAFFLFELQQIDVIKIVSAPVNGLLIFQKGENIEHLRNKIFGSWEIAKRLMKPLNNSNSNYFKSKVIHRLWLKALGSLIIEGVISVAADENSYSSFKQTMGCLTGLLKSNDKEISSNALIIYSAYLFQEILRNERKQMTDEELSTLSSVLKMRSSPDSDIQEKLAIAKIMNYCFEGLIRKNIINGNQLISCHLV